MDGGTLIARAQAGDREALGELLLAHRAACYAFALRLARRPEDAEDVCQEAFARAAQKLPTYRGTGTLRSWLLGLVLHVQRDLLDSEVARRRREGSYAMERGTVEARQPSGVDRAELRRQLDASLAELDENYRLPIVLTYEQGLSHAEAAAVLSMPEGTVKTNVRRGLEELRGLLSRAGYAGAAAGALEAALSQAPAVTVPAGLTVFIKGLAIPGVVKSAAPVGATIKGGLVMKIGLGIAAAGLVAGGAFWAVGGKSEEPAKPKAASPALSSDWREEQWVPEDFIGALGGGPPIGPAAQAGGGGNICGDKAGNLYLQSGDAINIVTPEGVLHRLAGTGQTGYRDGPANQAQFDQGGDYNVARSIQCDELGNVYTAENGNKRVRRIFRDKDGKWMVDTVAGGGKRKLNPGESCPPLEVDLGANIAVVAAPDGTLTIGVQWSGVFRVDADHKTIRKLGGWPAYLRQPNPEKGMFPCLVMSDGDRAGNAYFVARTPDLLYQVTADGKIAHIGITPDLREKQRGGAIGDGPPLEIYFDTPTSLATAPGGECVYVCGGDEYDIRRIPTDMKTTSATLLNNGRWYSLRNMRVAGGLNIAPGLIGKPTNEGGPLRVISNCHIFGRDYEGNLYGSLYPWVGATLSVEGKGQLRTGCYRFRRVK